VAAEIREVVQQEPAQPGQQFLLRVAAELPEMAMCLEECLLHQVRCATFGAEFRIEFLLGDRQQIPPACLQDITQGIGRSAARGSQPSGNFTGATAHGPSPERDTACR